MRTLRYLPIAALTLLAGCASRHTLLTGGAVRNRTGREITEVAVTHLPAGRTIYANDILPGREMTLNFHETEMYATAAEITWTDPAFGARTQTLPLDNRAHDRETKHIVYVIRANGDVAVHFESAP